ncbi:hypothetical protein EVAR_39469_1 [Eumeta japonica]|uniref:RNA-directed DNA polymerase from transposon BS n=1 Tax=Eumeta variegata TaxID=151549 RepID=A0A4C1W039_EUMVA|nr:hypothetical protein EVAR_39469_1 [Eumeta japonica]
MDAECQKYKRAAVTGEPVRKGGAPRPDVNLPKVGRETGSGGESGAPAAACARPGGSHQRIAAGSCFRSAPGGDHRQIDRHQPAFEEVNSIISEIVEWFSIINLLHNEGKTKLVKFSPSDSKLIDTKVVVKNEVLDIVDTALFLDLTLDSKLRCNSHITRLVKRLGSAAYVVKRIRRLTDESTARLVCFSFFHSLMTYVILLWGYADDIKTLFVLQKRAIRAVYNLRPMTSLKEKFKEMNILTLASQYIYENLVYVKRNIESFQKRSDIHDINTRHKNDLAVHKTLSK